MHCDLRYTLPLGNAKDGRVGPITPAQLADLTAGLWYVTIHTSHHAAGEIRGQIRSALAVRTRTWGGVKEAFRDR